MTLEERLRRGIPLRENLLVLLGRGDELPDFLRLKPRVLEYGTAMSRVLECIENQHHAELPCECGEAFIAAWDGLGSDLEVVNRMLRECLSEGEPR